MDRPEFEIVESTDRGRRVLKLRGYLDLDTVTRVGERLEHPWPTRETVLDLSELTFIDSTGMAFLIKAQREAEGWGRRLLVRNPPARIRATLRISGLLPLLHISDD